MTKRVLLACALLVMGQRAHAFFDADSYESPPLVKSSVPVAAVAQFSCSETETGQLLSYWKLDENVNTSAADSSSGTYTGTLTNTPEWVSGTCGSAVRFTSSSLQYIAMANDSNGIVGDTVAWSVNVWFKSTTTVTATLYSEGHTVTAGFLYLRINEDVQGDCSVGYKDTAATNDGFLETTAQNTNNGAWHMMTAVASSKSHRDIFLDGAFKASNSVNVGVVSINTANIGVFERATKTNYFDGTIDQVRTYNVALTTAQILNLYSAGK